MDDEGALLLAFLQAPEDDALRLVLADWLEVDQGEESGRSLRRGEGVLKVAASGKVYWNDFPSTYLLGTARGATAACVDCDRTDVTRSCVLRASALAETSERLGPWRCDACERKRASPGPWSGPSGNG